MTLSEVEAFISRRSRFLEDIAMETDGARDESLSARSVDSPLFLQEKRILTRLHCLRFSPIVEYHLDDKLTRCKRVFSLKESFYLPIDERTHEENYKVLL